MAYHIEKEETVEQAFRRIALEQLNKGIEELRSDMPRDKAVHQVRKRFKKIRGLLRLVRESFGNYKRENVCFRDLGRRLSDVRDADAMVETFEALRERYRDELDTDRLRRLSHRLRNRARTTDEQQDELSARVEALIEDLLKARKRLEVWSLEDDGFRAVAAGFEKTYARGRKAMKRAYDEPTDENFHEWRKRAKYHWYHTRLLRNVWPEMMKTRRKEVHELTRLLGDDHDLAVFRAHLAEHAEDYGDPQVVGVMLGLIDRRRAELHAQAEPEGKRIFAEKPSALARRFRAYWESWHANGKPLPAAGGVRR